MSDAEPEIINSEDYEETNEGGYEETSENPETRQETAPVTPKEAVNVPETEEETRTIGCFAEIKKSQIYIVEVDGEAIFYNRKFQMARRQAKRYLQDLISKGPCYRNYYIDEVDEYTFSLISYNKFCIIQYDTPVCNVTIKPLYRVREL
jgi:hypothetical protein